MKDLWIFDLFCVLIFKFEYEWEWQWVNLDGSCMVYFIYVNEGFQFFYLKDNKMLILYYVVSGLWLFYYCVGMLIVDVESDLLDLVFWIKSLVLVFQ